MRDLVYKLHRRLLPDDEDVGWVPYLWLVYLGAFIIPLFNPRFSTLERVLSVAALGVFFVAYFHGYWTQGTRTLLPIAVLVLLGAGFVPFNTGAIVFFIYGASFAALVGPPRTVLKVLGAILAVIVVEGVLVPLKMWSVAPALVISTLIGLVNLYYVELGRKKRALALSTEEIRRLAATAERERIARDLHDLLGHTLSVIALKSELASRLVNRDVPRAAEEIRDVERISREALAEVRAAVTGYRSGGLAAEVIGARLALAAAGVTFTWETEGAEPSAALEPTLALVLREAVTNVVRHANARNCTARLVGHPDRLVLEVKDDGRGGPFRERSGLLGMRERVTEAGGSIELRGGAGTTVVVSLPTVSVPALAEVAAS